MLSMFRLFADDNSLQYSSNNIYELLQGYPYFPLENYYIMKQDWNHFQEEDIQRN